MEKDLGFIEDSYWASYAAQLLVRFTNGYKIYDCTDEHSLIPVATMEQQGIKGVAYVHDEWHIVVQGPSGLTIFNTANHKTFINLDVPPQNVSRAEWSPDGKWLACGAEGFRFALWRAENGHKMFEHEIRWAPLDPLFADQSSKFERLHWSADSKRFSLFPDSILHRQLFVVNAANGDVVAV